MIGKSQIQITATQMAGGLATSDYLGDGGIGVLSSNINPVNLPGTITATATSVLGNPATFTCINLIATAEDPETPTSGGRIAVDANGNWYRYAFNTNSHLATGTPGQYTQPQTDMISFNGLSFASVITNIARLVPGSGSLTEAYWTTTLSQSAMNANYPHPMLVYQQRAWVADGNNLNNWYYPGGTPTAFTGVLVLRVGETITALGVDPGTGLMMIGVSSETDGTAQLSASNFILLYDGYSSTERRRIPVEGHVSCFNNVGGTMFVGIDASIGTWNGNGVTFLRRFSEVGYPPNYALLKHRVSSFQNHLLVAAGANLYGFGDIQNGKKVWYPLYTANARVDVVAFICNDQAVTFPLSPLVLVGTTVGSGALLSTLVQPYGSGVGTGTFYTNNINFPRPVFIRHMRVFTTGITTTTGIGSVGIIDETQTMHNPVNNKFIVASTATPKYVFDFPFAGQKLSTLQPVITLDTQAFSVTKIVIYYDTAE